MVFFGFDCLKFRNNSSASSIDLEIKLTSISKLYFTFARLIASQAEIFRMAGPESPQCVISKGPLSSVFNLE
jgi:hypothetical protein